MPTYQYACTECGYDFETVQSFTDDALTECPNCHGRLRKVFNAVGIVFKGSGFYRTDSRSASPTSGGAKTDGAKTDGAKTDGAADKPAAKDSTSSAAPAASTSTSTSSTSSTAGSAA